MKFIKVDRLRWAVLVMKEESDPAKKILCILVYFRPKLRWCNELDENVAWVGCRCWRVKKGVAEAIWRGEVSPKVVVPMVVVVVVVVVVVLEEEGERGEEEEE